MKNPYQPEQAIIKSIISETNDTATYSVTFVDENTAKDYSFKPGQFNMITTFGFGEAPISISSDPEEKQIGHTVRKVGSVTEAMALMKTNATIGIRGPYGRGWPMEELEGKDVLIIAGGIGLAPLRPVITQISKHREKFGHFEIIYGARTPADGLFKNEYESWRGITNTSLHLTVDRVPEGENWDDSVGLVTKLLNNINTKPENSLILVCGPEIMMKFIVRDLLEKQFSPEQIYVSMERRMKCGIGKCGNCQVGPKFVCKDGPVFTYKELSELVEEIF